MTKEIPNESTFEDCAFAGCIGKENKVSISKGLKVMILVIPELPAL
jgi:hypothetical protein